MDFSISTRELRTALARVAGVIEKKVTMPVLGHVLVQAKAGRVTVTGFDLDIGAVSQHEAEVTKEGSFLLQAALLKDLVSQLPEDAVRLKRTRGKVEVTSGNTSFSLVALEATDYPALPPTPEEAFVAVSGTGLLDLVRHVTHAMSSDDTRPMLHGAFLQPQPRGAVRMVATDGHRLAMLDRPLEGTPGGLKVKAGGALLPRKAVVVLKRLLEEAAEVGVEVAFSENLVWFRRPGLTFFARCVDAQFPEYQRIIPQALPAGRNARLGRQRFLDALKRMSLVAGEDSRVVMVLKPGRLSLKASNHELGEAHEDVDVTYEGPEVTVGFNARYLMDALSPLGFDEVLLDVSDETSPGVLRATQDDSLTCVVMPMRIG